MHIIEQNVALGLIEVTVDGFWDEDHFDGFVTDLQAAIAAFPRTADGTPPMTLYNYSRAWIQPQAVVTKMRALAQHPTMCDRRVAMYTDGVLGRQQAKRVAEGRENMGVFGSREEALAFLRDDAVATESPPQFVARG